MDEDEVNMIILLHSPAGKKNLSSTMGSRNLSYSLSCNNVQDMSDNMSVSSNQSQGSNSPGKRIVSLCRNCDYAFRTEYKPQTEFCSKDCETSFCWFMKKDNNTNSMKNEIVIPTFKTKSIDDDVSLDKVQSKRETSFGGNDAITVSSDDSQLYLRENIRDHDRPDLYRKKNNNKNIIKSVVSLFKQSMKWTATAAQ